MKIHEKTMNKIKDGEWSDRKNTWSWLISNAYFILFLHQVKTKENGSKKSSGL